MTQISQAWGAGPSERYEAIAAQYRPIFDRIAQGAVERELQRGLPFEELEWLREAGFMALRVPEEYGGQGVSLPEYFNLLVELAQADSNLVQAVRGHAGFVENVLNSHDAAFREHWLARISGEKVFAGPAWTEPGDAPQGLFATRVSRNGDHYLLNGVKFYTTGSLYANWIEVGCTNNDDASASVLVRRDDPGVHIEDDWDGFGQKLTASGTVHFKDVRVEAANVNLAEEGCRYATGFFQLFHLAALAGIGRRLSDEAALAVRRRKRNFSHANTPLARHDPQILQVIGQLRGAAYAAGAVVLQNAAALQRAYDTRFRHDLEAEDSANAIAELEVSQAQGTVISLILHSATILFDALGASATFRESALDRFWRNARTLGSHNPRIYKDRIVGDFAVNGTLPPYQWRIGVA
ncbi:acyl-CoA dehydrogenase family protein [Methylobacillus pratensis]